MKEKNLSLELYYLDKSKDVQLGANTRLKAYILKDLILDKKIWSDVMDIFFMLNKFMYLEEHIILDGTCGEILLH